MAEKEADPAVTTVVPVQKFSSMLTRSYNGLFTPSVAAGLRPMQEQAVMMEQADQLHVLMVQLNQGRALSNNQALLSAGDVAMKAEFFNLVDAGNQSDAGLKRTNKWIAAGSPKNDQWLRDEVRMGLWGARPDQWKDQKVEDLFASIEARDQALDNAMPAYWSKADQAMVRDGLNHYMDRKILAASDDAVNPAKARDVSFVKMGSVFASLSTDAESLYNFARVEVARSTALPEDRERLDGQQEMMVTNAQGVQKYPTIRTVAQNMSVAGAAGVAYGWAGVQAWKQFSPMVHEALEHYTKAPQEAGTLISNTLHHVGMMAATHALPLVDKTQEVLGAGLTVGAVMVAARAAAWTGELFGTPTATLARLDKFVHNHPEKFQGVDPALAAWQQADFFMTTPYQNLSNGQLSEAQTQRFVEGMGYARAVVRAEAMSDPRPDMPVAWPAEVKDRLSTWSTHEFVGLANFKEPALANAYLFHTNSLEDRVMVMDVQRRMSFLGRQASNVTFDDQAVAQARAVAENPDNRAWTNRSVLAAGDTFERKVHAQLDRVGTDGQRMLSFLPEKDRLNEVARLHVKPLDETNPTMDLVRRLDANMVRACQKVETPGFVEKTAEKFLVKKILGVEDGRLEHLQQATAALWNNKDRLFKGAPRQSFDFEHYNQELVKASGLAGEPLLLNGWQDWIKKSAQAQAHHRDDHPPINPYTAPALAPAALPALSSFGEKLAARDRMDAARVAEDLSSDRSFQDVARRNSWTR